MPNIQGNIGIGEDTQYLSADMTTIIDNDYLWVGLLQLIKAIFQPFQDFP